MATLNRPYHSLPRGRPPEKCKLHHFVESKGQERIGESSPSFCYTYSFNHQDQSPKTPSEYGLGVSTPNDHRIIYSYGWAEKFMPDLGLCFDRQTYSGSLWPKMASIWIMGKGVLDVVSVDSPYSQNPRHCIQESPEICSGRQCQGKTSGICIIPWRLRYNNAGAVVSACCCAAVFLLMQNCNVY